MSNGLLDVLYKIHSTYEGKTATDSEICIMIDIGETAKKLGYNKLAEEYKDEIAIVPLREKDNDSVIVKNLSDLVKLESGLRVSERVAKDSGIPYSR